MNKADFFILQEFIKQKGIDQMSSLSISQLTSSLDYSKSKIYNTIKILLLESLIDVGVRDQNSETYFINANGLREIEKLK